MQPVTLEQGTRLDDRYHLERRVGGGTGCTLWRAVDQVLSRRVAVRTVEESSGLAESVLQAARAASVVGDPRLVRVLDASRTGGLVYVVTEWVEGISLATQLDAGPLDPGEAAYVVGEVAEALDTAHRAGVAHLCLSPHNVLRSRSGEVRVTGLGVAAALTGTTAANTARADAHELGALLYAALTARWPSGEAYGLPAAPSDNGLPHTPRQVRAGIPRDLENIVQGALYDPALNGNTPLSSPGEVSAALAGVPRAATRYDTLALPMMPSEPAAASPRYADPGATETYAPAPPSAPGSWEPPPPHRPEPGAGTVFARRMLVAVIAVAVLLGIWQVALELMRTSEPAGGGDDQASQPSSEATGPNPGQAIQIQGVEDFDPPPDGNGEENAEQAPYAIDGDPATSWQTMNYYNRPDLGGLKSGVGLLVELPDAQHIGSVDVRLDGSGTDLELRGARVGGESVDDYAVLATARSASGTVTLRPEGNVQARYLLVWLTKLPPGDGGYRGGIAEITVKS